MVSLFIQVNQYLLSTHFFQNIELTELNVLHQKKKKEPCESAFSYFIPQIVVVEIKLRKVFAKLRIHLNIREIMGQ